MVLQPPSGVRADGDHAQVFFPGPVDRGGDQAGADPPAAYRLGNTGVHQHQATVFATVDELGLDSVHLQYQTVIDGIIHDLFHAQCSTPHPELPSLPGHDAETRVPGAKLMAAHSGPTGGRRPATRKERSTLQVIDGLIFAAWIVFWLYWLAASRGVKPAQSRSHRLVGVRIGVVLVLLLLLRTGVFKDRAGPTKNAWLQGIGLALFLGGLSVAIWARVYLGRNWGTPMTQKVDPELVTTGPYRHVRHPIYSGIILAMIGTTVAVSVYWLAAVVIAGVFAIYSAVQEERTMSSLFPDSYPAYKRSTKMLVPFVF